MLDLVIEQGMSARQAGLTMWIVVRTAQHYVKMYSIMITRRNDFPVAKILILGETTAN
jgi:hypothetical protein